MVREDKRRGNCDAKEGRKEGRRGGRKEGRKGGRRQGRIRRKEREIKLDKKKWKKVR